MKKIFILLALIAVCFSSCSEDYVIQYYSNGELETETFKHSEAYTKRVSELNNAGVKLYLESY